MLHISTIRFSLRFQRDGHLLPWIGAVLRGAFGGVLREFACRVGGVDCGECPLVRTCAYGYLFRTPVPASCSDLTPYTHAPHPFAFRPPMIDFVSRDKEIDVDLLLVGKGTEYLPYFRIALAELGRRGLGKQRLRFRIAKTRCVRTWRNLDCSPDAGSELAFPLSVRQVSPDSDQHPNELKLFFMTPLYLEVHGRELRRFDFRVFILATVRRLEDLALWHCGVDLRGEFHNLIGIAKDIRVGNEQTQHLSLWRSSATQGRHIPVGGLSGGVSLAGDLRPFATLFDAAEHVGVGKKTSFGLGQVMFYRWEDIPA